MSLTREGSFFSNPIPACSLNHREKSVFIAEDKFFRIDYYLLLGVCSIVENLSEICDEFLIETRKISYVLDGNIIIKKR